MGKDNRYHFREGDFVICKPAEELREPSNIEFEIYARVVKVDPEKDTVTLDRYLKCGQLHFSVKELPLTSLEEDRYYQPMNKQELATFITGLSMIRNTHGFSTVKDADTIRETHARAEQAAALKEEKMMHTLLYTEYGGMDWHDSCTVNEHLLQDGSYDIKDPDMAKAKFIYKDLTGMAAQEKSPDGTLVSEVTLVDIPGFDEIYEAVKNGEDIRAASKTEHREFEGKKYDINELEYFYEGVTGDVTKSYCHGQITYHGHFIEQDIPLGNVRYIAAENFLAPTKGVSSVQRFYHEPYTYLGEAKKALEDMQLHEGYSSVKELYIIDIEKEKETEWYKDNVAAFGAEFSLYPKAVSKGEIKEDNAYIREAIRSYADREGYEYTAEDIDELTGIYLDTLDYDKDGNLLGEPGIEEVNDWCRHSTAVDDFFESREPEEIIAESDFGDLF